MNVDADVSHDGTHGAVGIVFQDATGLFRGASSRTIEGISDPATLESMACVEALSLVEDLLISKMEVSNDCL
jgi:hypothetical protein